MSTFLKLDDKRTVDRRRETTSTPSRTSRSGGQKRRGRRRRLKGWVPKSAYGYSQPDGHELVDEAIDFADELR